MERYAAADRGERPPTVPTGIQTLDWILGGGFRGREMAVLAARTSVGKSALACWIAVAAALAGKRVLYASREMTVAALTERIASVQSRVAVRSHEGQCGLSGDDRRALVVAFEAIKSWGLHLRDDLRTIDDVRAEAGALKPDLVIVDHVGIFDSGLGKKATLYEAATSNANACRDLAFGSGAAVLCLSQINRVGGAEDAPRLDHLKGTGALEEDARVVILLHREEEISPTAQRLKLNLAKNTSGSLRTLTLKADMARCQFEEESAVRPEDCNR